MGLIKSKGGRIEHDAPEHAVEKNEDILRDVADDLLNLADRLRDEEKDWRKPFIWRFRKDRPWDYQYSKQVRRQANRIVLVPCGRPGMAKVGGDTLYVQCTENRGHRGFHEVPIRIDNKTVEIAWAVSPGEEEDD